MKRSVEELQDGELQISLQEKGRKKRVHPCPVCKQRFSHVKRHVLRAHLPWYVSPHTSCWECGYQGTQVTGILEHFQNHQGDSCDFKQDYLGAWSSLMAGLVSALATELGCKNLKELLQKVLQDHLFVPGAVLTEVEEQLFEDFGGRTVASELPKKITISPPNCIPALLHWRILAAILSTLPQEVAEKYRSFMHMVSTVDMGHEEVIYSICGLNVQRGGIIDSHCHLGESLSKHQLSEVSDLLQQHPLPGLIS